MKIDVFQSKKLWEKLTKYNQDIIDVWDETEGSYSGKGGDWWFDPAKIKHLYLRIRDNSGLWRVCSNDKLHSLILYPSYYLTIWLINILYKDKKGILIEDVACGSGGFVFYLSKLGFNNFSLIDNFSQLDKPLLEELMKKGNIKYVLNKKGTKPIVTNAVAIPSYNTIIPNPSIDSCELFCFYPHPNLINTTIHYLLNHGYVELCEDAERILVTYCKKKKYQQFYDKIKKYETKTIQYHPM